MYSTCVNNTLSVVFYTLLCELCESVYVFSNRVIDVWNSLPDFIVPASSLNDFKNHVHSADLSKSLTIV